MGDTEGLLYLGTLCRVLLCFSFRSSQLVSPSVEPPPYDLGQGELGPQYSQSFCAQGRASIPLIGAEQKKGVPHLLATLA